MGLGVRESMGKDRRETTFGFKVDDQPLQDLAALLAQISTLIANIPSIGSGQQTFGGGGQAGRPITTPPTPNYQGSTTSAANLSPGGRGINPAALGGAPPAGGAAPVLGGSAPAPALGGGGSFALSGAVTFTITGAVTIHAAGAVNFVGGTMGAGGGGYAAPPGGGAPSPSPTAPNVAPPPGGGSPATPGGAPSPTPAANTPATPQQIATARRQMMLGALTGHPMQYLDQGPGALETATQYYAGAQVGHLINRVAEPSFAEARYYQGLHYAAPEDVSAMRWRMYSRLAGGTLGGIVGGLATGGTPFGIGAGAAMGSGMVGEIGEYMAAGIDRAHAVRVATQKLSSGLGVSVGSVNEAFQSTTTSGQQNDSIFDVLGRARTGTGQFRDMFQTQTISALGSIAPGALTNRGFLGQLMNIQRRMSNEGAQEAYGEGLSSYASQAARNPYLANLLTAAQAGDGKFLDPATMRSVATLAAVTGDLGAVSNISALAGGGVKEATGIFAELQGPRGRGAAGQAAFGATSAAAGVFGSMGYGIRAGEVLGAGASHIESQIQAKVDEMNTLSRLVDSAPASTKMAYQAQLDQARAQYNQLLQQRNTLPLEAAGLAFGERQAVSSSRLGQRQAALATRERTNLFDERTDSLYGGIEGAIREQVANYTQLLRDYKRAGAGPEKMAPIYKALADLDNELDALVVSKFERKFRDMDVPAHAGMSIEGSRLRTITGTGQIYGPGMESAFRGQRGNIATLVDNARRKYYAAVSQFGADSPQAIDAQDEWERRRSDQAVLPFQQIGEKYAGLGGVASATGAVFGGAASLVQMRGGSSLAAFPYTAAAIGVAGQQVGIAQGKLREDTAAGAGAAILSQDRAAVTSALLGQEQARLGGTAVSMGANYDIAMLQARNKLQRMQTSWVEPGNMLDSYRTLYTGAMRRIQAIDAQENKMRQAGIPISDAMHARFEEQREQAKMEAYQYKVGMEDNWIDRLMSYSIGAPSFYARARPSIAEAAWQLESGQSEEGYRQARPFGFVSQRGFQYERGRGFSTAGAGNLSLFPGDLATAAILGKGNAGRIRVPGSGTEQMGWGPKRPGGLSDDPGGIGDIMGGGGGESGASEGTLQDLLNAANQQVQLLSQLLTIMNQRPPGGGPTGWGATGVNGQTVDRVLLPGVGDVPRARPGGY